MVVATVALGLVIGLVIGGLGGGGGALTVPALVYLLGLTAQDATTSSVLIVGISSLAGALTRLRDGSLRWRTGFAFAAVGVPAAYVGSVLNHRADQAVVLVTFAVVTVVAAVAMLVEGRRGGGAEECAETDDRDGSDPAPASGGATGTVVATRPTIERRRLLVRTATIVGCGAAVGFLTGFLGVGGGFLVMPVLVIALRMPLTAAVGTSLLIMVLNAATAFASRFGDLSVDWAVVVPFTLASVAGTLIGRRVADRLSGAALTRIFAVVLLLVGIFVGVESLLTG
jgi:uncharacterized membrane protein YfcA